MVCLHESFGDTWNAWGLQSFCVHKEWRSKPLCTVLISFMCLDRMPVCFSIDFISFWGGHRCFSKGTVTCLSLWLAEFLVSVQICQFLIVSFKMLLKLVWEFVDILELLSRVPKQLLFYRRRCLLRPVNYIYLMCLVASNSEKLI